MKMVEKLMKNKKMRENFGSFLIERADEKCKIYLKTKSEEKL